MSINIQKSQNKKDFAMAANLMAYSEPWITLGMNEIECLKAFEGDFKEVYVIYVDENFAGFIILQTQGSFKGYIQTICIHPSFRGQGLGTKLINHCEKIIVTYSPNIFICVSSFNQKAYQLYTSLGFEKVGELPNFVKQGFTEILLRKTKGPLVGYTPQ